MVHLEDGPSRSFSISWAIHAGVARWELTFFCLSVLCCLSSVFCLLFSAFFLSVCLLLSVVCCLSSIYPIFIYLFHLCIYLFILFIYPKFTYKMYYYPEYQYSCTCMIWSNWHPGSAYMTHTTTILVDISTAVGRIFFLSGFTLSPLTAPP